MRLIALGEDQQSYPKATSLTDFQLRWAAASGVVPYMVSKVPMRIPTVLSPS